MKNLLFMCVANSARSQIAEGLARKKLAGLARVESAGSVPTKINPWAVAALAEVGIDAAGQRSKAIADLPKAFIDGLDLVITLCAEEVCPVLPTTAKRIHWPLPDPAGKSGDAAEQIGRFRATREAITVKLDELIASLA